MGLPNLMILFKSVGTTAIQRGETGVACLILKDTKNNGLNIYDDVTKVPTTFSATNLKEINRTFLGYITPPKKVVIYTLPTDATDYSVALGVLETVQWDYLAIPGIVSGDCATVATWIKGLRDNKGIKVQAVLPEYTGDHEGIINFATNGIVTADGTYAAKDYCGRIAGLLCGTPLQMSSTYAVLPEVIDVPHKTISEFNADIDAGKLVLINDGEKCKIARGVNSLTTLTVDKGADFQKIKIVSIMDLIHDDIKKTVADNYTGKVPNDYDHKCLLITAIKGYYAQLENDDLLEKGKNTIDIDIDAQKAYIQGKGVDVTKLNEQQIKEYNTGSVTFLGSSLSIIDAMEDLNLSVAV